MPEDDKDKTTSLVDSSIQSVPAMDQSITCPDHPGAEPAIGFGLAGGGYGVYTYCPECGRILSKDQEVDA